MPAAAVVAHRDQRERDRIAAAIRARGLQVYAVEDIDGVMHTARQARLCAVLVEPYLLTNETEPLRPRIAKVLGYPPPVVALTHEAAPILADLKRHGASVLATPLDDLRPLADVLAEVARRLEAHPELMKKVTDVGGVREGKGPVRQVSDSGASTILVVDDEQTFRTMVAEALKDEGYKVMTAASAQDAVLYLSTNDVDLVISDVNMPGMDGFELKQEADRLRKRPVPFIVITADASLENVFNADSVGAVTMLAKPLRSLDELFKSVKGAIPSKKKSLADRF